MKLTIESTPSIIVVNGVPGRVWEGTTGRGTACRVFVLGLALVDPSDPAARFELDAELASVPATTTVEFRSRPRRRLRPLLLRRRPRLAIRPGRPR